MVQPTSFQTLTVQQVVDSILVQSSRPLTLVCVHDETTVETTLSILQKYEIRLFHD